MSDIQFYLLEVDKDKAEARKIAFQSASKLQTKQLKLIDLITSLEEYINNREDDTIRSKTIAYLADVLENLPSRTLSGQERRLLSDFVLGRIEGDLAGIGSSARTLIALETLGKWDDATAQKVARTFVDHANPLKQFKLQTERHPVIQLFDMIMAKYRTPLKSLHEEDGDFLSNFIFFFEGEKDPRNLMMIFSILHVPMAEWDVHAYAKDLFESVFNYFPVTFKPPPDDPYGITAQDLKDRLRDCISANSDFAPFAFPQLLDKLDSAAMNTKRDVLQAIQACVAGYTPNTINLYSVDLWDALKFEILNVQEEDLAEGALTALSLIAAKFAKIEGPLTAYLRPIIKECNEHLEDAPTKASNAAGRILHAVAASAPTVADKTSQGILPTLFRLYNVSESITKRRGLLEVFNEITKAYVELAPLHRDLNVDALGQFAGDSLDTMVRVLQRAPKSEVSFRLTALECVVQLLAIPALLPQEQSYRVVDTVTEIILHEKIPGHGDIRSEAITALNNMARSAPNVVRDRAIPAFMVDLPDVPEDGYEFGPVIEAFAQLSTVPQVFDTVVLRLRNKSSAATRQLAPPTYQRALLLAILYAFTHGSPLPDEDGVLRSTYFAEYAEPLIATLRDARPDAHDDTSEIIGRISNSILRPQTVHFQNTVYNNHLHWLSSAQGALAADQAQHLAPFLLYYYSALRPEVVEPAEVVSLLQIYTELAMHSETLSAESSAYLRILALLINKFINPKAMQPTLDAAKIEVESLLSTAPSSQSTGISFTIVKALLIQGRCPALTTKYLQTLLHLLSTSDKTVPKRFASLLAEDDILTKQNHCVISGLYKQKTLNQTVPPLVDAVRTADATTKPNYLIALSGILRWLPYDMLAPSLHTLITPLLQTLDLVDQDPKSPTLTLLEAALMHDPESVASHAAELITRLLNCTAGPVNGSAVRAKALRSLALVPKQMKREVVLPRAKEVVRRLVPCLDDPKRDVRAEAVRCRKAWLGLEEGEEKE